MDTDRLLELIPHYIFMFILVFLILAVVRALVGEIGFWIELGIVIAVVFIYRSAVTRLGIGPRKWE